MAEDARWPAPWVRAALELAILGALRQGLLHGYALAQALAGLGLGRLRGGSLYAVLSRPEQAGHVRTSWVEGDGGPGRKDYTLTPGGRRHLARQLDPWHELTRTIDTRGDHDEHHEG